jgi:hypothetical protein
MQVIYRYLVTSLLPAHLETELQGGSMPRHPTSPFSSSHYGRSVTTFMHFTGIAVETVAFIDSLSVLGRKGGRASLLQSGVRSTELIAVSVILMGPTK